MLDIFGQRSRSCGECRACCSAIAVQEPEIAHPRGTACKHLCGDGCGIYATRPKVCVDFACAWLEGVGDESDRPDKLGVILFMSENVVDGVKVPFLCAAELEVGALDEGRRARATVDEAGFKVLTVLDRVDGKRQVIAPLVLPRGTLGA